MNKKIILSILLSVAMLGMIGGYGNAVVDSDESIYGINIHRMNLSSEQCLNLSNAGINSVIVDISWLNTTSVKGIYDYSHGDIIINTAQRCGFSVAITYAPHYLPTWVNSSTYNQNIWFVNSANGNVTGDFIPFRTACATDTTNYSACEWTNDLVDWIGNTTQHFTNISEPWYYNQSIKFILLGNEMGYSGNEKTDYSSDGNTSFQNYLANVNNNVTFWNTRWGTSYNCTGVDWNTNFTCINPPITNSNKLLFIDWMRFREINLLNWYNLQYQRANASKLDTTPISTKITDPAHWLYGMSGTSLYNGMYAPLYRDSFDILSSTINAQNPRTHIVLNSLSTNWNKTYIASETWPSGNSYDSSQNATELILYNEQLGINKWYMFHYTCTGDDFDLCNKLDGVKDGIDLVENIPSDSVLKISNAGVYYPHEQVLGAAGNNWEDATPTGDVAYGLFASGNVFPRIVYPEELFANDNDTQFFVSYSRINISWLKLLTLQGYNDDYYYKFSVTNNLSDWVNSSGTIFSEIVRDISLRSYFQPDCIDDHGNNFVVDNYTTTDALGQTSGLITSYQATPRANLTGTSDVVWLANWTINDGKRAIGYCNSSNGYYIYAGGYLLRNYDILTDTATQTIMDTALDLSSVDRVMTVNTTNVTATIFTSKGNDYVVFKQLNNYVNVSVNATFNYPNGTTYFDGTFWSMNDKTLSPKSNVVSTVLPNKTYLGIYALINNPRFNLTSLGANIYDVNENVIDAEVPVEITLISDNNITFNSTQNYTNTDWLIYILGDKTNKLWKYKGHDDTTYKTIQPAMVSYDGTYTLFNLTDINVHSCTGSNGLIGASIIFNTTNSDWYGNENVGVTENYLNEPNLTKIRINNTYNMNKYDLLLLNLSNYLSFSPNDIINVWYDSYTGNTDNSTLKDTSDYSQWVDTCESGNTTGQVGCWNFNELYGTTAHNRANNSINEDGALNNMNTGIDNGSSGWTREGKFGNAIKFSGVNDYVSVADDGSLNLTDAITVSIWINGNNVNENYLGILEKGSFNYGIRYFGTTGRIQTTIDYTNITAKNVNSISSIFNNTWAHIVYTWNTTDGYRRIYIDGTLDYTDINNYAGYTIDSSSGDLNIGEFSSYFNGTIDEVKILNRAWTPDEVLANYNLKKDYYDHIINAEDDIAAGENLDIYVTNGTTDTPPTIDTYYQWNSSNDTVDFGIWTDGFVSINWNISDVNGINVSTCDIKVRNYDIITGNTNMSYVDDLIHPDYDQTTGYKDLTCYTEDLGDGIIRVSANMTGSYDWRPLNVPFDQDSAAQDNAYHNFGGRSTKMVFHNITNTINTTFIFLADVGNQTNTVADMLFYSCNETYLSGDFTTDDNCALVGASTPNSTRDVNFNYVLGALTTDENGSFGGVIHTSTMYGISYCPSCTNTGNSWITYSTNVYDGHSATSPNQGASWTDLTGEEFNVILHVIDNTRLEFNLTIEDNLGNELSDLQTDNYGALENRAPFGDIVTDSIEGSLVSYYDIHGIVETGTICVNVTASDPNGDTMNVSIYLLNNDSSYNQTLLANYSIEGFGLICHQWNTSNVSDGDYRLNVTAFDGFLTGYDESSGFIRVGNDLPVIDIIAPTSETTTNHTPYLNISVDKVSNIYYSIDGSPNVTACTACSSYETTLGYLTSISHTIIVYANTTSVLWDTESVTFTIFDIDTGSPGPSYVAPIVDILDDIEEVIIEKVVNVSYLDVLDIVLFQSENVCLNKEVGNQTTTLVEIGDDLVPIYRTTVDTVCLKYLEIKVLHVLIFLGSIVAILIVLIILNFLNRQNLDLELKKKSLRSPFTK